MPKIKYQYFATTQWCTVYEAQLCQLFTTLHQRPLKSLAVYIMLVFTCFISDNCIVLDAFFDVTSAVPWNQAEKEAVERQLGFLIQIRRAPRKNECLNAIRAEPALQGHEWLAIKNHIASKVRYARQGDAKRS
jgi:hypothetical protein